MLAFLVSILNPLVESHARELDEDVETILAVFAHPDDEVTVGPILARYGREDVRVHLAIVTDGRFGVTEHAGIPAGDALAAVRAREARCSAEKLGIEKPELLGFPDGFSHRSDDVGALLETQDDLNDRVTALFEALRPDVVITWGPDGGYGHPDHRIVGSVVTEVFQRGGDGWPSTLLYPGFSTAGLQADRVASGSPTQQWFLDNWNPVAEPYLQVRVRYGDADLRSAREAQACHASQFTPEVNDQLVDLVHRLYDGEVMLRSWNP